METLKFNVFNFLNKSKKTIVPHIPLYNELKNDFTGWLELDFGGIDCELWGLSPLASTSVEKDHNQGQIKEGQRGQLPRAPLCKGAPVMKFICSK